MLFSVRNKILTYLHKLNSICWPPIGVQAVRHKRTILLQEVGQRVRAARKEEEIPLNPFTAGVYIATMMATVQVLREKVRVSM